MATWTHIPIQEAITDNPSIQFTPDIHEFSLEWMEPETSRNHIASLKSSGKISHTRRFRDNTLSIPESYQITEWLNVQRLQDAVEQPRIIQLANTPPLQLEAPQTESAIVWRGKDAIFAVLTEPPQDGNAAYFKAFKYPTGS